MQTHTEIVEFVETEFMKQVEFCQKKFNLDNWLPKLTMNTTNSAGKSCGGVSGGLPFISLSLYNFTSPVNGLTEYRSYHKDPIIGGFTSNDWKLCCAALIAHELSHAIQYTVMNSEKRVTDIIGYHSPYNQKGYTGHGILFRKIYSMLRNQFINPFVPASHRNGNPIITVPDEVLVDRQEKHPLIGTKVQHWKLGLCTVIDYLPTKHKYPFVIVTAQGRRYRDGSVNFKKVTV